MKQSRHITITGLVQGVGFRPFIYRLADRYALQGWVENSNEGVKIHVEGEAAAINTFVDAISKEAPTASDIKNITSRETNVKNFREFFIKKSEDHSESITDVSPDICVCDACLEDMRSQRHRMDYPFINCTNCGPRFTIIRDLPYDRPMTTMDEFEMCEKCHEEYTHILDRRFHAQPIACNECGPHYSLMADGREYTGIPTILEKISGLIAKGSIVAMKGLGGFHLACDALNVSAVNRLREAKNRDGKPFAVMFRDLETARKYAVIGKAEERTLSSWQRPITLLETRKKLAPGVSVGFGTVGGMLPYLPFHYLLFDQLEQDVIVLTSGNISDEPIIISNEEAIDTLGRISDAVLINNRDIYNRTDDSVVRVINKRARMVRRSRSWAPRPVDLDLDVDGIFACGAELVNCFCIGKGRQAILSQHIGDLKNAETLEFYSEAAERFSRLFRMQAVLMVHDMHPDYLSSRYARESGIECVEVQHHHAHIASCMAEHGLDEKVIGISFDGVGLGDDGHVWGGEFMICDLAGFERKHWFDYVPMPGGDMATKEPWRMALSYLIKTYGDDFPEPAFLASIPEESVSIVKQALKMKLNTPLTSSTGRLFDAAAALCGLCNVSSFHAEAPMRLEAAIDISEKEAYPFTIKNSIDTGGIIKGMVEDLDAKVEVPRIAARFHNSVINIIFAAAEDMAKSGIRKIVLSGGSFQNKYLLENAENGLIERGFEVYTPENIPANDGGLALGQLVIAAARRRMKNK
ncbi:MAG: carbamoyltransferase HypF [Bacteroidales bacterium]|jgi:hydrogenase maturation protein HypF|nr:carbamoyltransferase HypF [Bacteroidales bacterium]